MTSSDNLVITSSDIEFKILKNENLEREFEVSIKKSFINEAVSKEIGEKAKTAKMPGFRPGKVPLSVVRQQYLPSILQDSVTNAVNNSIRYVLDEEKVKPAAHPNVDVQPYDENQDLSFKFSCEIMPEIKMPDFSKIKIEKLKLESSEEEMKEQINSIAKNNKNFVESKGKAAKDDVVNIDFVGKIDGEEFEGGKSEKFDLLLGSASFIPGFEDQLEGSKAGDEVIVKVSFPEDYGHADFAGKKAEFEVKVNLVKKGKMPTEEELAKKLGYDDIEKMKEDVKKTLHDHYDGLAFNDVKKTLFDHLEDLCKYDIPPTLLKEEYERLESQIESLKSKDESLKGKSDDEIKAEFKSMSERRVKIGLLVAEIAVNEKLHATNEELAAEMQKQAAMFQGREQEMMDYMLKNPELIDSLKGPIVENKAVEFMMEKVNVSDKLLSKKDFDLEMKKN